MATPYDAYLAEQAAATFGTYAPAPTYQAPTPTYETPAPIPPTDPSQGALETGRYQAQQY